MKRKSPFSSGWLSCCAKICAIAVAIYLATPSLAFAEEPVRCRPGSTRSEIARSLLPEGTELAHAPVQVSLGPSKRSLVVLYRKAGEVDTNYRGWVLVPAGAGCSYKRYALPEMDEAPTQFQVEVRSVFTAEMGREKERVLVVLYWYHRNGSADDPGYASYVYRWKGDGFVSLSSEAEKLVGLKAAAQIRRKLRETGSSP